jgi:hypothetical protein
MIDNNTTWKREIHYVLPAGETIIACTISEEQLNKVFDSSYGGTNGIPFTAWSENWVFFPLTYDGSESVGCAPRNPCDISMAHQGGG